MFKHILIPTDGSSRSMAAVERAVKLAREQKARVTGLYVAPPLEPVFHDDTSSLRLRPPRLDGARAQRLGRKYMKELKMTAAELGVPCEVICTESERPYEEIVRAARRNNCDLICMASHGRTGLSKLLLGSQTAKVLALSRVPVLVIR